MEHALEYWRSHIKNVSVPEFPFQKQMDKEADQCAQPFKINFTVDLTDQLKLLGQRQKVTLFMVLVAAYQTLLYRYSQHDDILISTPIYKKNGANKSEHLGAAIEPLLLRTDLSGNPPFTELLERVRRVTFDAFINRELPFGKVLEMVEAQSHATRNELIRYMLAFQSQTEINSAISELPVDLDTSGIRLICAESEQGIIAQVDYPADQYDASSIVNFMKHFRQLLEAVAKNPTTRISELSLINADERQRLLFEWNATQAAFPALSCIHELFEAQVQQIPDGLAVVNEAGRLTYDQLNRKANQLAHKLRALGVGPDSLVAICSERSLNMLVGMLGILKAGGAYVPLNPLYPVELLTEMLNDSSPVALLTQAKHEKLFVEFHGRLPIFDLEADHPIWLGQPEDNLDCHSIGLNASHLAYVIYTSGSTGKPKGVMIEHKGLCNMITDLKQRYRITAEDRVLQFASIAFDMSVEEIFVALLSGASLFLRDEDLISGANEFWKKCAANGVTVANLPTLFWQQMVQDEDEPIPSSIRQVMIGGDAVSNKALSTWFGSEHHRPKLFNAYGPTETTVNATIYEPTKESLNLQSIGRPISNMRIYILDKEQQPVPIGFSGELYIGGVGVARGYLNRPELTLERFVPDPFVLEADARMYKTGDLARWLNDGTLEFLGRNDFQVKIRDYRVELGDIETKLTEHPGIKDVVVVAREDREGEKRLVAYLILKPGRSLRVAELRGYLRTFLPEYMVPSAYVFMDAFPVTPNGKLDRKALPEPDLNLQLLDLEFVAPVTEMELRLAEIWCSELGLRRVGIRDNFFELGGHSLLAVKVIVAINELFNTEFSLGVIYQSPTIEQLSNIIATGIQQNALYSLIPVQPNGSRPPLFAIHTITLENLPQNLGADQPLYFLRYGMAAKIKDRSLHLPPLRDLAYHYIQELQAIQPHGPYFLMGFSFGGLIAYEMACQLEANGHRVNFLGLLDTYLISEMHWLPLNQIYDNLRHKGWLELVNFIVTKVENWFDYIKYGKNFWPHIYTAAPDIACAKHYQPKPYHGKVTLFQGFERKSFLFGYSRPELAWRKILEYNLEVEDIAGDHFEIFNDANAKILSTKIISCMDKAMQV